MARTQSVDYDQKRDAITAAAAQLFAQKGFGGASLSDIARACDSSKSLIYHYYPAKEAILYDVMITHMNDLSGVCREIEQRDTTPTDKFRAFARNLLRHYVGTADSQKILLYEINNLPEDQRAEIIAKQRAIIGFAEDLLVAAKPTSKPDRACLRARIMLFFGMLNWTHTWYKASGPIDRDTIADMASDAALNAL